MKKTRPLNIAHLHWGFPPIIGGVETHLTILLPQLKRLGHNVSLLTCAIEGLKGEYKYQGVNIYRTPLMDLNWLYKRGLQGLDDEVMEVFSEFFDEEKPDIIHAHNMHYFSPVHARALEALSKKLSVPLILTAHNVWDDILYLELTHKIDWTHIIAVSHFIKKEIIGIGMDDEKITVVHHGVNQENFKPGADTSQVLKKYPKLKGKRIIFHPARIGLAKGCDISIKAVNVVKKMDPNVILVLAGSKNIIDWGETQQKDIAYMVDLVKHFGIEDNILIDMYTLDEVKQIYELSDICLYPSSAPEPFGLTMLEAMSMAKPMIVTNMGGMPEVIKDGINGFVVPMKDFEALAAKICQLLEDKKLANRFGYTGRQMVESHYTKELVSNETLAVYAKALASKGRG
ncbi:MAG: glycosyltransferase family 4 protein [Candidatus Omnitrophica bacterium]|nr:glycosyltransferase family 4 protein [Candidatus Omnitrophota bacterium]